MRLGFRLFAAPSSLSFSCRPAAQRQQDINHTEQQKWPAKTDQFCPSRARRTSSSPVPCPTSTTSPIWATSLVAFWYVLIGFTSLASLSCLQPCPAPTTYHMRLLLCFPSLSCLAHMPRPVALSIYRLFHLVRPLPLPNLVADPTLSSLPMSSLASAAPVACLPSTFAVPTSMALLPRPRPFPRA